MSMLAEKRNKVRYILNPRSNHWSSDSSKFGQRLLEKMGWKPGNGLGTNQQGETTHVKVSVRNDNRGVGFKERPEDDLPHQNSFSELLEQLSANQEDPASVSGQPSSLEEKSQHSRARVHYHKMTRGKDLSRYSERDLACILGKPTSKPGDLDLPATFTNLEEDGATKANGGDQCVAKKSLKRKKKVWFEEDLHDNAEMEEAVDQTDTIKGAGGEWREEADQETERKTAVGDVVKRKSKKRKYTDMETREKKTVENEEGASKKHKKRKQADEEIFTENEALKNRIHQKKTSAEVDADIERQEDTDDVANECTEQVGYQVDVVEKKKKKKQHGAVNADVECRMEVETEKVQRGQEEVDNHVESESKKIKKKKRAEMDTEVENRVLIEVEEVPQSQEEVCNQVEMESSKKINKKKRAEMDSKVENRLKIKVEAVQQSQEEVCNQLEMESSKKIKKKKRAEIDTEVESRVKIEVKEVQRSQEEVCNQVETESKMVKKKKCAEMDTDVESCIEIKVEEVQQSRDGEDNQVEIESKKVKKKKRAEMGTEIESRVKIEVEEVQQSREGEDNQVEIESKKVKKKKRAEMGTEIESRVKIEVEEVQQSRGVDNQVETDSKKMKKKKKHGEVDTKVETYEHMEAKNEETLEPVEVKTKRRKSVTFSEELFHVVIIPSSDEVDDDDDNDEDQLKCDSPAITLNGVQYVNGLRVGSRNKGLQAIQRLGYGKGVTGEYCVDDVFEGFPGSNVAQLGYAGLSSKNAR